METAGHLGIAPDRAVNYHCDSVGTRLNYEVVGQAVAAVRCSAPLDKHWKDAIEEDFRRRQKKGRLHSAASSGRWCGGQRPLSAGSGRAN